MVGLLVPVDGVELLEVLEPVDEFAVVEVFESADVSEWVNVFTVFKLGDITSIGEFAFELPEPELEQADKPRDATRVNKNKCSFFILVLP